MTVDEYVNASEAARILGVTPAMITYYVRMRDLFALNFGEKTRLLRRADVEAFKQRRAARL